MSEHAPDRIWSGIDIPKTIAGVLAAVSAAVVGSFLGVAGTLAGAAIASVVGSVGTEVYRKFIDRGHKKIVATFVTAPAAVGTAAEGETPSRPEPEREAVGTAIRTMRWRRVAALAAGVFVLAIGTLTAFELVTGKSASEAVGVGSSSSTTLGSVLGGGTRKTTPVRTPASVTPSEKPTTTAGTTRESTAPTEAATTGSTPSAAPTGTATPEPTVTDTQNTGGGDGTKLNDEAPPATGQPPVTK